MKTRILLALCAAAPLFGQYTVPLATAKAKNVPEIKSEVVPSFLKLPDNLFLGEGIGVASNSKGHVFAYTRSQATRIFEFDQNGKFVREIGEGLYGLSFAHAIRVDSQDNIWAVDEGTNMVIKFNPQGRVVMVIGHRPEPIDATGLFTPPSPAPMAGKYTLDRPTDVGWDPSGNIFISDGYGNSRVVKYDKNGKFVASAGTKGNGPNQLNLPHSMTMDAKGNVYIADRSNARIQVWDNDLSPKTSYDNVGQPWAVCITPGAHQYLYSSNSYPDANNSDFAPVSGEIYKMELDGTILGKFGKPGKEQGNYGTVHEIDCRNENELYTAEITTWRVQKTILHPTAAQGGAK
jgi:hypothetical protein